VRLHPETSVEHLASVVHVSLLESSFAITVPLSMIEDINSAVQLPRTASASQQQSSRQGSQDHNNSEDVFRPATAPEVAYRVVTPPGGDDDDASYHQEQQSMRDESIDFRLQQQRHTVHFQLQPPQLVVVPTPLPLLHHQHAINALSMKSPPPASSPSRGRARAEAFPIVLTSSVLRFLLWAVAFILFVSGLAAPCDNVVACVVIALVIFCVSALWPPQILVVTLAASHQPATDAAVQRIVCRRFTILFLFFVWKTHEIVLDPRNSDSPFAQQPFVVVKWQRHFLGEAAARLRPFSYAALAIVGKTWVADDEVDGNNIGTDAAWERVVSVWDLPADPATDAASREIVERFSAAMGRAVMVRRSAATDNSVNSVNGGKSVSEAMCCCCIMENVGMSTCAHCPSNVWTEVWCSAC
jgi:hypothetical protein